MKGTPLKTHNHCFYGKQYKDSFNSNGLHRWQNIIDLIHSDVFMMDGKSLGASYFITFIDEHSIKV